VSRVMVHLFSRLTRLISRVSRFSKSIPEAGSPPPPSTEQDTNTREPTREIIFEARSLRDDVDAWIERVQVGNRAYAYAMKVSYEAVVLAAVEFGWREQRQERADGRSCY
jgi:hypothetical protein